MNLVLLVILFLLMILIGGRKGIKTFFSLCLNFSILLITFYFIAMGINSIIVSIIGCLIISFVVLFIVNGKNIKTISSMKSVLIVLVILSLGIFVITNMSKISGFGYEAYEEINMFSYDIRLKMSDVTTALILIGLIGAILDSSIAISSALFEVYENNKYLSTKELITSGLNIGKDILGTTTNTLLFAFLGEFMTLLIWFHTCNYSLTDIINAKVFCAEFIKIMFSAIGCILVIPITSYITSVSISKKYINFHKKNTISSQ